MVSPATTDVSRTVQDLIPCSCSPDAGNSKAAWRLVSHSTKERPWHIGERRKPFCARVRDGRRPQEASDALDLEEKVFTREPRQIALSLRRSAERSRPRKATPSRSAMSMPTFHINRAGKNLGAARRRKLEAAKSQLRRLIGRE
jgi:hypothetical protein